MSGISNRWYTIGVRLGIKSGDLDSLNSSNQHDNVKLWMERMTKSVTSNTILEIIGSPPIQSKSVVMEIKKFLECEYLYNNPSNSRYLYFC